jgi:hypothetical protein
MYQLRMNRPRLPFVDQPSYEQPTTICQAWTREYDSYEFIAMDPK